MGYEIAGDNGTTLYFPFGGWESLLEHAIRNGWQPMGAVRNPDLNGQFPHLESGDPDCEDREDLQDKIFASYCGNDWQGVREEDARNLAVALRSYRDKLVRLRSILSIPDETLRMMNNADLDLPFWENEESFSMEPVFADARRKLIAAATPEELPRYQRITDPDLHTLIKLAHGSRIDVVSDTIEMCEAGGFVIC